MTGDLPDCITASVSVVYDVAELVDGMDSDERTFGSVLGLVHSMAAEDLNECAHNYELATLAGEVLPD
jgi:hypothetical protein